MSNAKKRVGRPGAPLEPDAIIRAAADGRADAHEMHVVLNTHPENIVFPPDAWGSVLLEGELGATHLHMELLRAPEGAVVVARCDACGGRREALADGRDAYREFRRRRAATGRASGGLDRASFEATMNEYVLPFLEEQVHTQMREFALLHRNCDTTPQRFTHSRAVQEFVQDTIRGAEARLQRGERAEPVLWVLLSDGQALMIPLTDVPASDAAGGRGARVQKLVEHQFLVREVTRYHNVSVQAVIMTSEAWMTVRDQRTTMPEELAGLHPGAEPDRQEALMVMLVTPTYGQFAHAAIVREGGVPDTGPGQLVRPFTWLPMNGPSAIADGLTAGECAPPLSAEGRRLITSTDTRPFGPPQGDLA